MAEELGGHLATFASESEYRFGTKAFEGPAWLGGSREKSGGPWKWLTGESWEFERWTKTDPTRIGNTEVLVTYLPSSKVGVEAVGAYDRNVAGVLVEWED